MLLFHWYVAVETWMRNAFWSHFDKIANFSWSKRALPFISKLVYGLKITPNPVVLMPNSIIQHDVGFSRRGSVVSNSHSHFAS